MWVSSYFIIFREKFLVSINIAGHIDESSLGDFKDVTLHRLMVQGKTQVSTTFNVQLLLQVTGQVLQGLIALLQWK